MEKCQDEVRVIPVAIGAIGGTETVTRSFNKLMEDLEKVSSYYRKLVCWELKQIRENCWIPEVIGNSEI